MLARMKRFLWAFPLVAALPMVALAGSPSSPGVGPLNVSIIGGNAGGLSGARTQTPPSCNSMAHRLGSMATQAAISVAITGGTVDGTVVGGTTPAAMHATTLAASGAVSGTGFSTYLASPPAIGGTAPAAGKFTTVIATGLATASGTVSGGTTFTIASGCGSGGMALHLRSRVGPPRGNFVANATACSPVLTLPTAPHGWWCNMIDLTHPTDTFTETAESATSCTMTVASAVTASDVIIFHAEAY